MVKPPLIGNFLNNWQTVYDLSACLFWSDFDVQMMKQALVLAGQGASLGEVPVGAVVVYQNRIIGQGFNRPISVCDPTAHAEIVAVRQACQTLNNYRLPFGATLYITLEPCTMCLGMLIHARISRIVFATTEPKAGVIISQENFMEKSYFNHKIMIANGLLAKKSAHLLSSFFKQRRLDKKAKSIQAASTQPLSSI